MLLGVDHFVIAVGDLAAAMRDYAALGFSVDSRGPGPYAARFTGGTPGAALDPRLTHGARLSFE